MMRPSAFAIGLGILVFSNIASATDITKSQCVDANTAGQNARRSGKLGEARTQFQACNDPKCPEIVRTDCTQRLDEIEAAFPSIVFDIKKGDGTDIPDVKISVDGKVVAEKNDGTALSADPGSHEFKFEVGSEAPISRTFVLKEGEKTRREKIVFGPDTTVPAAKPATTTAPAATSDNGSAMRYAGIGVGAAGIIGLGIGIFGGVKANSAWSDQQDHCASSTSCVNHDQALKDHDHASTFGTVATIGIVAGALLLVGGVVLYLVAPKNSEMSPQAKAWFGDSNRSSGFQF